MKYSDKYVQLPIVEINYAEEVKNEDGTTSVNGDCTIYYTYINPFDIVRFEAHSYSGSMTVLYTRSCNPVIVDMSCEQLMDLLDAHNAKS